MKQSNTFIQKNSAQPLYGIMRCFTLYYCQLFTSLPQIQGINSISDLRVRVANILQIRK